MSESIRCPRCGMQLSADAPAGLCPRCLVQAGLESESKPANTVSSPGSSGFVPPSVEELASKLQQLEILELLGKGGMGAVFKARQRSLDRLVAVKVLPPEIGQDATFADRFTREARALARLTHNHIVSVYDFGQVEGLFFIVMEYVDGVNLRQAIQSGGLAPADALAIVPQICEALQFAHDEGIVHRDIKPENILIDRKGRVKIADFGLAKLLGHDAADQSLTGTNQVMGTVRYMAPEQMEGTKSVDHRADIYSLGVVFYEMLTGELPLGRFPPPSEKVHIDVRLDEVVLHTLEKDPGRRYQHASEVKTDVEAINLTPPSQVVEREKRPESAKSEARPVLVGNVIRWKWKLLFPMTILLVIVAGVAVWLTWFPPWAMSLEQRLIGVWEGSGYLLGDMRFEVKPDPANGVPGGTTSGRVNASCSVQAEFKQDGTYTWKEHHEFDNVKLDLWIPKEISEPARWQVVRAQRNRLTVKIHLGEIEFDFQGENAFTLSFPGSTNFSGTLAFRRGWPLSRATLVSGASETKSDEHPKSYRSGVGYTNVKPVPDETRIQGTWGYMAKMSDGQVTDPEDLKLWKVSFAKGEYTEQPGNRFEKGTYKLDSTKKPKTIDCVLTEGPHKGLVVAGIYELDGHSLKICWSPWGNLEHPKEFSATAGSQRALVVLKRDKSAGGE